MQSQDKKKHYNRLKQDNDKHILYKNTTAQLFIEVNHTITLSNIKVNKQV